MSRNFPVGGRAAASHATPIAVAAASRPSIATAPRANAMIMRDNVAMTGRYAGNTAEFQRVTGLAACTAGSLSPLGEGWGEGRSEPSPGALRAPTPPHRRELDSRQVTPKRFS